MSPTSLETTQSLIMLTPGRVFLFPSMRAIKSKRLPGAKLSSSTVDIEFDDVLGLLLSLPTLDHGILIVSCNLAQLRHHIWQAIYCDVLGSVFCCHGPTGRPSQRAAAIYKTVIPEPQNLMCLKTLAFSSDRSASFALPLQRVITKLVS